MERKEIESLFMVCNTIVIAVIRTPRKYRVNGQPWPGCLLFVPVPFHIQKVVTFPLPHTFYTL